jgi:hypothetical protein
MPKYWMVTCGAAALAALAFVGQPEPAQAQFGISIGGLPIGINLNGGYRGYRGGRQSRRQRASRDEAPIKGDDARASQVDRVMASAGAPSSNDQTRVLAPLASSVVLSDVGSTKDLTEVGQQTVSNDRNRDYTAKIADIIKAFKSAERKARDEARKEQRGDTRDGGPGDVTAHAIEQSLEKAVKNAKLDVFERFVNEAWTSERLRTLILDRVYTDLARLFEGNNRGNAPMEALDTLIQRAAEAVYHRIFETSELLAANRSSALFMQRLYQTHGGLVEGELRETADSMITRASMAAIGRYESTMRRDVNGYAFRYRAQRIVFDCLSENVEKITSAETGMRTNGEIERKIVDTSASVCGAWLNNQFGSEKSDLKPQRPMPVRVIWSAMGPKDDPSMYGRALNTF